MKPVSFLLGPLLLIHLSCGTLSHRLISDPGPSAARLKAGGSLEEEVQRLVRPLIAHENMDSVVVGVLTPDGGQHLFSFSAEGHPPAAVNGLFQIGSVSKVFVAAVLAVLVHDGVLEYKTTVREILPAGTPVSQSLGDLTLYELVTHTGGLPRSGKGPVPFWQFLRYLFTGRNLYAYIDHDYIARYLKEEKVRKKDKGNYLYSNIGAGLLAYLMEVRTRRSFSELAEEKIFKPLGMTDTAYELTAPQKIRLVQGHAGHQPLFVRRGRPLDAWDMGDPMRYAGGLYSTAGDLLRFAAGSLGQTAEPLASQLASLRAVQLPADGEYAALGWKVDYAGPSKTRIFYKHGMVAGYSVYLGFNAETKTAAAVLGGTFDWDDRIGHNLLLRLAAAYS